MKETQMTPQNQNPRGRYSKKRKSKFRRRVDRTVKFFKNLYNRINKNDVKWYWDIRKWSPIILLALIITFSIGSCHSNAEVPDDEDVVSVVEIEAEPVQEEEETEEVTEPMYDEEAVALAILADTSANGKSDEVKTILMWVAINRSEDHKNGYGGTLLEEIYRPKQWQCYDPEGMYLQSTYDLALNVLNIWRNNGPRPIYNDMLWSVYNSDGTITVRNRFKDTKGRVEQTFG